MFLIKFSFSDFCKRKVAQLKDNFLRYVSYLHSVQSSTGSKFQIKTKSKMSVAKRLGLLKASTSALFLCDMQVKFAPSIAYFPEIVKNSKRVLGAAQIFDLPVLATEQYPKGMEYLPIYVHT